MADSERLKQELNRMRELLERDPEIRAHFDLNGDGVIDGYEWDQVRQLVERRLEREDLQTRHAEAVRQRAMQDPAYRAGRQRAAASPTVDPHDPDTSSHRVAVEPSAQMSGPRRDNARGATPLDQVDELELQFDPRQRRGQPQRSGPSSRRSPQPHAAPRRSVAEEIYRDEIPRHFRGATSPHRAGSLGDFDELILEQTGGLKRMSKLFRRQYVIRNSEGKVIGEVKQRENENLQRYFERGTSIFDMPDLNFDVEDHVSGLKYVFTRTSGLGQANAMFVENERGTSIATTQWVLAFAWATYSIEARGEDLGYTIKRPFWRPLNLDILDAFEDCVGSMQVGWSGLGGFLTGGSLFRLQVDGGQVSGDVKWGLLAAALLVDWESETRR